MRIFPSVVAALAAGACAGSETPEPEGPSGTEPSESSESEGPGVEEWVDPGEKLPEPRGATRGDLADATDNPDAPTLAIEAGIVMTAAGDRHEPGTVILEEGAITYAGEALSADERPAEVERVIDARDRYVTPALIDTHSHMGVYASPSVDAHHDGNEMTDPFTPQARAEYGYWPQDPAIPRALAGGVTTALILPGSANLVGGRGFTAILEPGRSAADVAFPGAPPTVKMACGENPKRVYEDEGGPQTRMAKYVRFRQRFHKAASYRAEWETYRREYEAWETAREEEGEPEKAPTPPERDLGLDTLVGVMEGDILPQIHCYRADDISNMVAIADEMGFSIRAFHHALEAYKVRDRLVERDISISTWADWWGFKMEAFDGIVENAALFADSGGRPVIHSDSATDIQRLNQEAAKALHAGRRAGLDISDDEALRWVTANAAWTLGIEEVTGTLEEGKRADVVIWSEDPLSVYALADVVIRGGGIAYERDEGRRQTDFELKNAASFEEETR